MRKISLKLLLFLSFVFLFSCSQKKEVDNDLPNNDLVGNVYECTEFLYNIGKYEDGSVGETLSFSNICTYDRMGFLVKYIQYDSENNEKIRYVYKIDDRGNTLEKRFFRPDGSPGFKIFYKYDGKNNKTEELHLDSSNILKEKYIYKYNSKGQLVRTDVKKKDTTNNESYEYIYDSKGNLIRENYFYGIDLEDFIGLNLDKFTVYKYNDKGKLIETVIIQPKTYSRDETYFKTIINYGNENKLIEKRFYNKDGISVGKSISLYNDNGKEIETNDYTADGSLEKSFKFKYDENDRNIEEITNKPKEGKNYTFRFEYTDVDHKGNWLTYIEYYNNEPSKKTTRKISYY